MVELMVALVIVAILIVLSIMSYDGIRARTEQAACMTNLRGLHGCFAAYVTDRGHWPQVRQDLPRKSFELAFINAMKPYGASERNWLCPTLTRAAHRLPLEPEDKPLAHYTPTLFDAHPLTPYKWSNHPWLIEDGDAHGRGNLMIRPDGSIHSFQDVFGEQAGADF